MIIRDKEVTKRYEGLAHEVVGDNYDHSPEYASGEIDGATFEMRGEWYQTCCVSLFCPGDSELRGEVIFTEGDIQHFVDFDEHGCTYMYSRTLESHTA